SRRPEFTGHAHVHHGGDGGRRALRRQPRVAHPHHLPRPRRPRLPRPPRHRRLLLRTHAHLAGDARPLPPPRRLPRRPRRPPPPRGRGVRVEYSSDVRAPLRHPNGRRHHLHAQLPPRRFPAPSAVGSRPRVAATLVGSTDVERETLG
ncbi:Os03g0101000, partial [Oryza sativa Japonica Group]